MNITKGKLVTLTAVTAHGNISVSGIVCDIDDIGFSLSSSEQRVSVDWHSVETGQVSVALASERSRELKLAA